MFDSDSFEDWFERTTLNNKELTYARSWTHVALIFIFTMLTIRAVQKTRADAKIAYQFSFNDMSKSSDHEWLKARTVHVKGIAKEDRRGDFMKKKLEEFLKPSGGKILGIMMVPDFVN